MAELSYPGPPPPVATSQFYARVPPVLLMAVQRLTGVARRRVFPLLPFVLEAEFASSSLVVSILFMSQSRGISVATALRHRAFFTLSDSACTFSAGPADLGDWSMIGAGDIYVARANIGLVVHDQSPARSPNLTIARSLDTLLQTLPSAGAAALEEQRRLIAAVSVEPQEPVVGDRVRVVATGRNGRWLPTLCFATPPEVGMLSQLEDPHITFEARRSGTAQIEIHAYDEKTLTMCSNQLQLRIRPR